MTSTTRLVYLGSFTRPSPDAEGVGITLASQHPDTGALELVGVAAEAVSPSFLAWHPGGRHLYAVNSQPQASVTAYQVRPDGRLTELGSQPTGGADACHLSVHPSGSHVVSANYGDGSVSVHPIGQDGSLGERTGLVRHTGSGPHPRRQRAPHAHQVRIDPSGRYVFVPDLGIDAVLAYTMDPATGRLSPGPVTSTDPGAGPRHLVFAPDGHAHVVGELNSTVNTFRLDPATGRLDPVGVAPSCLATASADNLPSEIAIAGDGRFLYVANRGLDVIGVLAVDGAGVRAVADVPTGGAWPRHLAVAGSHLYVANEHSHQVTHFHIDQRTGVPELAPDALDLGSPSCVLFAPA